MKHASPHTKLSQPLQEEVRHVVGLRIEFLTEGTRRLERTAASMAEPTRSRAGRCGEFFYR